MHPFRDLPLRSKLTVIIMTVCCVVLVLGGLALTARYAATEQQKLCARMTVLAKIGAANVAAAVTSGDRAAAQETLAALAVEPSILAAAVRDRDGSPLADFVVRGMADASDDRDLDDRLGIPVPIVVDGETIGSFLIDVDLRPLRVALLHDAGMFSLIIAAAGLVALMLSARLQKIISQPIIRLAHAMKYVSRVQDYSARVEPAGQDEIGTLIEGFNDMLAQIRVRDEKLAHHRRQLEDAQRIARLGNWEWDVARGRMALSMQACEILGLDRLPARADLETFLACVHSEDRERVRGAFSALAEGGALDLEHRLAADRGRHVQVRGEASVDGMGKILRFAGSVQDVSERARSEEELRIAANALESIGDAVAILDSRRRVVSVNRAFSTMTGYRREEVVGRTLDLLRSDRHDRAFHEEIWRSVRALGQWHGEIWERRRSGEVYPQWVSIGEVRDKLGKVSHFVSVGNDISERKQYESRLEFQAHHDALTQLPNHVLFKAQLDETLLRAKRNNCGVGVMFIDLDRFKAVNDTFGHEAGDLLLKAAAARMKSCLRASDLVGRLGGDEFAVILDELDSCGDAAAVAEKLVSKLAASFELAGRLVSISASIGVACYPDDGSDGETLLKSADAAMYRAKESGRCAYRFHSCVTEPEAPSVSTASAEPVAR
ncbi:MAG: diguanylate cyclase [Aromatoleum sp.]|uniref:diguanylate cyclase domain-containing protein n=1 Tax=Aromatoleum sp. TaxID=2307007 RepID=UPI0028938869|nr:diguanylate cyclase [Aromatoleum sp.]MDT3670894.1 diguanylate cyclase [Aromatoleum sp.]